MGLNRSGMFCNTYFVKLCKYNWLGGRVQTLQEIRDKIDELDANIIRQLVTRKQLVESAAQFKDCEVGDSGVRAPSRIESMLVERRKLAVEHGLNPDFVEKWFSDLIEHNISLEMERWLNIATKETVVLDLPYLSRR